MTALLSLFVTFSLNTLQTAQAQVRYIVKDLGILTGYASVGSGVNNTGQIAGTILYPNLSGHAFLSAPNGGALTDLGTLGGTTSNGWAVNDSGQVAGSAQTAFSSQHAYITAANGGPMTDLGTFGGRNSTAWAINNLGQAVGGAELIFNNTQEHAFTSSNGGPLTDLGTLGGSNSVARAVNFWGRIAGTADVNSGATHAFLTPNGGGPLIDLGTLGGPSSYAFALTSEQINPTVVGASEITGGSVLHAFKSGPNGTGPLIDLGTLGGTSSYALGVSPSGVIVGYSSTASGTTHGFQSVAGIMTDLNDLILTAPEGFSFIQEAHGINGPGLITGRGDFNGTPHAILLTPVVIPEPWTSPLIAGLAMALIRRRRRERLA